MNTISAICFISYRQKHGEYPVYPTDDEGGSDLLLKNSLQEENDIEKVCLYLIC